MRRRNETVEERIENLEGMLSEADLPHMQGQIYKIEKELKALWQELSDLKRHISE